MVNFWKNQQGVPLETQKNGVLKNFLEPKIGTNRKIIKN